ncbi:MAG: cytochrome D1 domain-containing protein [Caldilineaceae bacterium]
MTKHKLILLSLVLAAILLVAAACKPITAPSATEAEAAATVAPVEEAAGEAIAGEETYAEMPYVEGEIRGQTIEVFFIDTCSGCHGAYREGALGPALVPERLDAKDEFYFATIKDGRPGTSMDPYGGGAPLHDEEVQSLVAYIKSEPSAEAFVWEVEQALASLEVLVPENELPDAPTHSGNIDNLMLVTERENRGIAVFDGDTHTFLGKIEASYRAHGYTFDPVNPRWAYNLGRDGWLFKIDLYTLQAVTKIKVGLDSRAIAISDDGKYVICGNYIPNTAMIVDTATMEPVKVIYAEGNNLQGDFIKSRVAGLNATSRALGGPYFIMLLKEAGQAWRIDYSDSEFPIEKIERVGDILHEGFSNPDQSLFYATSQGSNLMGVIDVANWKLVKQIPTGNKPHPGPGAVWEASDGTIYAATLHIQDGEIFIWDTGTNKQVARIPTVGPGLFIRTVDNTPYVWADALFSPDAPNTIYAVEKDPPFAVHELVVEGCLRCLHPEPTANGKFVYISDWTGNKVYVYNAETLEKVTEFPDIITPTGIFNSSRRYETLGH